MNINKILVSGVLFVFSAVLAAEAAIQPSPEPVDGQYIVVLRDDAARGGEDPVDARPSVAEVADDLVSLYGGTVGHVYQYALKGFSLEATESQAQSYSTDPRVDYVEQDSYLYATDTQTPVPSWGLDRIDQRFLPLNDRYTYCATGLGVKAYILDTGVRNCDLDNRMARGYDAITFGLASPDDCNGHGTHVASTVGGRIYGVAKRVTIVPVRVLNCAGAGLNSQIIAGVDWVTQDHQPSQPAVANMSLSGGVTPSLDTAVRNSIADGIVYTLSAGNVSCSDSCFRSPARVPEALTVAATDRNDSQAGFSNGGPCVDLYAPGVNIVAADWLTCGPASKNGTSMAAPHVAGAVAQYLERNPVATSAQAHAFIVNSATPGVVSNVCPANTPNRLLYVNHCN